MSPVFVLPDSTDLTSLFQNSLVFLIICPNLNDIAEGINSWAHWVQTAFECSEYFQNDFFNQIEFRKWHVEISACFVFFSSADIS